MNSSERFTPCFGSVLVLLLFAKLSSQPICLTELIVICFVIRTILRSDERCPGSAGLVYNVEGGTV